MEFDIFYERRIILSPRMRITTSRLHRASVFFIAALVSIPVVAQTQETERFSTACGSKDVNIDISFTEEAPSEIPIPPGKSALVFVGDFRGARPGHRCIKCDDVTMYLAVDGNWLAGTKGFSHSSILINAGAHHLCARTRKGKNDLPTMLNLQAEPGKTYYLIAVPQYEFDYYVERFSLADPDEGRFLTQISRPTKLVVK